MPLCNLKSEELVDYSFHLLDPHTQNTKYYVPSAQIPRRDVVHASHFLFRSDYDE